MKQFLAWIVLGVFLLMVLVGGNWAYRYFTAPIEGTVNAEQYIESAGNRISTYEEFYGLCSSAQAMQDNIAFQKEMMQDMDKESSTYERTLITVSGMNARLNQMVREYNSASNQEYTSARFKSKSLPDSLVASQPILRQ